MVGCRLNQRSWFGLYRRKTYNLKMVLINYIVGAFKGNVKQTPLFHIEEIINKMIFIKTEKPQINNFVSITKQSVLQIAGVKCKHSVDSLLHHGEMWSGALAAISSSGPPA